jgi:UDP-N-acetylglucosamine--N-acetylmuramyl-(pentapeptide) pyrophosphoryl-undecaprenol N-acetylglucosamine transferase
MKIVFTGGGTGGHFYPLIAVAQKVRSLSYQQKILDPELFYLAATPYNEELLRENNITFYRIPAGKTRRYFSIQNFTDIFKTLAGFFKALSTLFSIYPDVIFSKGSYMSVPVILAAAILRIPIFIHESDSKPGRANLLARRFATRVAVSYPDALQYFDPRISALTGNPIRDQLLNPVTEGAHEFLDLTKDLPTVLILGGSLGAQKINDAIIDLLPELTKRYQIIHQVGKVNEPDVRLRSQLVLEKTGREKNYHLYSYLNDVAIKMAAGSADLVISRAGSTIFEIAQWGKPSIIIPIPENISHDQRRNAFTYARSGACIVIEENNLSESVLKSEIDRLFLHPELLSKMGESAKSLFKT